MATIFIENRDAWIRMSEIDYVGQFVKTWLAFNAWYRNHIDELLPWNFAPSLREHSASA